MPLGRRIVVFGPPASGKSTLCRELSAILGLPLIHVDALRFLEQPQPPVRLAERLRSLVGSHQEGWISDGAGPRQGSPLLEDCDTVIQLKLPLRVIAWRAGVRRAQRLLGRDPHWPLREPLSRSFGRNSFLYWLAVRRGRNSRSPLDLLGTTGKAERLIVLSRPAHVARFLAEVRQAAEPASRPPPPAR